jgi:carbon monoxide dehydrogenase subunit G
VNISGTKELAAPRDRVWQVINEPSEMAKLMPGVESFEIRDDRHWTAKVKVPLGLGGLKMTMNFEKLEEREPEFASMRAKGTGVGALMDMTTSFTLWEAGEGTSMAWEAQIKIAGPVGAMGQRVLQPIVNQQVSQVLSALEKNRSAEAQFKFAVPLAEDIPRTQALPVTLENYAELLRKLNRGAEADRVAARARKLSKGQ